MYDLVIRNGKLIDPSQGIQAEKDIAVTGGRIAALLEPGSEAIAKHTLDVRGLYVVPGLIDHPDSGLNIHIPQVLELTQRRNRLRPAHQSQSGDVQQRVQPRL